MMRHDAASPGSGGYLSELRRHRRALVAASAGMGSGFLLNHYVNNLFAPRLIEEFQWSRSDFALIGTLGLVTLFIIPIIGRLTDTIGVRLIATVGIISFPLTFVAFSLMNGSLFVFAGITVVQTFLAGATTSSTVYSRLIAERFENARGFALAIIATIPALIGILGSPLLHEVIETHGWRAGYVALAAYTAIVGGIALLAIPRRATQPAGRATDAKRRTQEDYAEVLRNGNFWIIAAGFMLCNLVYPLQSSQMNLMLLENGASASTAALMVSVLAAGVMTGRFCCGFALDRFPTPLVAAIAMGMPALGLFALAAGASTPELLAASVMLVGLSLGAESDLAAYLVMRYFRLEIYGTVLGLVVTTMAASAAIGAVVLSATLRAFDHFSLYLALTGVSSLAGGLIFLFLYRQRPEPAALLGQAG